MKTLLTLFTLLSISAQSQTCDFKTKGSMALSNLLQISSINKISGKITKSNSTAVQVEYSFNEQLGVSSGSHYAKYSVLMDKKICEVTGIKLLNSTWPNGFFSREMCSKSNPAALTSALANAAKELHASNQFMSKNNVEASLVSLKPSHGGSFWISHVAASDYHAGGVSSSVWVFYLNQKTCEIHLAKKVKSIDPYNGIWK